MSGSFEGKMVISQAPKHIVEQYPDKATAFRCDLSINVGIQTVGFTSVLFSHSQEALLKELQVKFPTADIRITLW